MRKRIGLVILTLLCNYIVGYSICFKNIIGYRIKHANIEISCTDGSCEPAVRNPLSGICSGHIVLNATAIDNCKTNDDIIWEYKIDLHNDGIGVYQGFDLKVTKLSLREFKLGKMPSVSDNPFADRLAYPFDASGTYPIGVHRICWKVENECGEMETCCKVFEIKDCQAPTPYCLTGIITVPLKISGCVDIWAKDLDHGSFDNCSSNANLKFFFDGDINKTNIRICCDDFVKAGAYKKLNVNLEMWVEDEEGNRDYCRTSIVVTDEFHICPSDPSMYSIIGQVKSLNNELLGTVETTLFKNGMAIQSTNSNPFKFLYLGFFMNDIYDVKPRRNDDHLNGVSTADIIKIHRHVLGKSKLNSPYLLIAADVNNSKSITSSDISEIRKLVLGITEEFSRVNSWTYVPMNYIFSDPEFPFDVPRSMKFTSNVKLVDTADFIGIKMGDVTVDARASNLVDKIVKRSNQNFSLRPISSLDEFNKILRVEFYLSSDILLHGMQFAFQFDQEMLDWNGFSSGQLDLEEDNINELNKEKGIITLSWDNIEPIKMYRDKPLFSFEFRKKSNHESSYKFTFNNQLTKAEIYDEKLNEYELKLENEELTGFKSISDVSFQPNPWQSYSKISFTLFKSENELELIIFDQLGKAIYVEKKVGERGFNYFELDRSMVPSTGIYYYEIVTKNGSKSGKMLVY